MSGGYEMTMKCIEFCYTITYHCHRERRLNKRKLTIQPQPACLTYGILLAWEPSIHSWSPEHQHEHHTAATSEPPVQYILLYYFLTYLKKTALLNCLNCQISTSCTILCFNSPTITCNTVLHHQYIKFKPNEHNECNRERYRCWPESVPSWQPPWEAWPHLHLGCDIG